MANLRSKWYDKRSEIGIIQMVVGDNYEHVEGGGNMVKKIRTFIALLVLDTHT